MSNPAAVSSKRPDVAGSGKHFSGRLGKAGRKAIFTAMMGLAALPGVALSSGDVFAQDAKGGVADATTPQGLTDSQCKRLKGLFMDYVKDVGRENLSDDFVHAMVEFAVTRKCAAPASIPVDERELAIFNSIYGFMYKFDGVDLKKMGIVPVARRPSLR